MDANNTTEQTAIQTAIKCFTDRAPMNCGVMYKEFMQVAAWLGKLAAYQDETYISAEFLMRNGFEKRQFDYLYCDDCEEISAKEIDSEAGVWRIEVGYLDGGSPQKLDVCTVGQFVGLHDDNDSEIYEGDIIHIKTESVDKDFGIVKWNTNGYFFIDDTFSNKEKDANPIGDFFETLRINHDDVEITINGNIHDNPELIKKEV